MFAKLKDRYFAWGHLAMYVGNVYLAVWPFPLSWRFGYRDVGRKCLFLGPISIFWGGSLK